MLQIRLAAHQKQRAFHLILPQGFHPERHPFECVPIVEAEAYANGVGICLKKELLR